ncbi:MAG: FHA domain-containing protein [Clostridiales bacterium]|nr:FHA domain-containing protein [Clostridiales bacterium]
MEDLFDVISSASRYVLPAVGVLILVFCSYSLLKYKFSSPGEAGLVETKTGEVIPLTHWENAVGRSTACDVVAQDMSVSRFHGVIARRRKGWTVIDTYSKTGIFVNGRRIESKTILENGDTLSFGKIKYKFQIYV